MNRQRADILIERAQHLIDIIRHLQGDSAIVHDSNKYLNNLEMCIEDFKSEESLQKHVSAHACYQGGYSEEDVYKNFEFRLERAAIAIENYINRGDFNCGYWHEVKDGYHRRVGK
jgi:hypothetical protein